MVTLLWLAICNIEDRHAAERAKERGQDRCRTTPLVNPDRIEPYLTARRPKPITHNDLHSQRDPLGAAPEGLARGIGRPVRIGRRRATARCWCNVAAQ